MLGYQMRSPPLCFQHLRPVDSFLFMEINRMNGTAATNQWYDESKKENKTNAMQ